MRQFLPLHAGSNQRAAGIVLTGLVHAALLLAWIETRRAAPPFGPEPAYVQWVRLPEGGPPATSEPARVPPVTPPARAALERAKPEAPDSGITLAQPEATREQPPTDADPASAAPSTAMERLVEQARRDAGAIERALRKESKPTIVLPPDSPQIRMENRMREAAALAPNRLWEAPKIVELVNDGGDGARRFRVLTAAGVYCITERSPATSIDMIEKHGKQRITNCGTGHEQPANPQQWRTTRD